MKVDAQCTGPFTILSIHSNASTTVSLRHSSGSVEFCVRLNLNTGHQLWCVATDAVAVSRWYHVVSTWEMKAGLGLYINGQLVNATETSQDATLDMPPGNLRIGQPRSTGVNVTCPVLLDDFNFWTEFMNASKVTELGAMVCFYFSMERLDNDALCQNGLSLTVKGEPSQVEGKIGKGLLFDKPDEFLVSEVGLNSRCIANLEHCQHGFMFSAWMVFTNMVDGAYYFDSGYRGLRIFCTVQHVTVTAMAGSRQWMAVWKEIDTGHWHFVEITWSRSDGLELYIDQKLVSANKTSRVVTDKELTEAATESKLSIGRANKFINGSESPQQGPASFVLDELRFCYGNLRKLSAFGFVQRGRPQHYLIDMNAIKDGRLVHQTLEIVTNKSPLVVPGKIGNATRLDGDQQFVEILNSNDSCISSLVKCSQHGLTISLWVKFRRQQNYMYYLSTGDGLKIFYVSSYIVFELSSYNNKWSVKIPGLQLDTWYFIELTWSSSAGLIVYINGQLGGAKVRAENVMSSKKPASHFLIGYAADSDATHPALYADFIVDDVEIWLEERANLLAFNYIARGNITHRLISFDEDEYDDVVLNLHNGASYNVGKVNRSLHMLHGQFATLAVLHESCLSNLLLCSSGIMIAFSLHVNNILDEMKVITSRACMVSVTADGRLHVQFMTPDMVWDTWTEKFAISAKIWNNIELSWHHDRGVQVYIDKSRKAFSAGEYGTRNAWFPQEYDLHLGWLDDDRKTQSSSEMQLDEMEFWFADRDHLKAFGWLEDDVNFVILDMEHIMDDLLVHPSHVIYVHGRPNTVQLVKNKNNGVLLNGLNQYLDAGKDIACKNNLDNCPKGFTLRFKTKPFQLADHTYFLSSAPVDVYFKDGQLVADVRTQNKQWRARSPDLKLNIWQQIDISWHAMEGLKLYISGTLVDQDVIPATNEVDYNSTWRFLIGRANTDMRYENYANGIFDDVEFWESKRSDLMSMGYIKGDKPGGIRGVTQMSSKKRAIYTTLTTQRTQYYQSLFSTSTMDIFVQIPTGLPYRDKAVVDQYKVLPTLPPDAKKKLVFDGSAFIKYDLRKLPQNYMTPNLREHFYVKFQTNHSNGLLLYTGDEQRNIHLSLKNGVLLLVVYYGEGQKSDKFKIPNEVPPPMRLDDNEWHDVYIMIRQRQVSVKVDDRDFAKELMSEMQLMSPNGTLYVAGSDKTPQLTNGNMRNNFRGIIDKVIMNGTSLPSDINFFDLTLIKPTPTYVEIYGNVMSVLSGAAPETIGETAAVTFTIPESYIRLSLWDAELSGSIEIHFKTVEPHALLVYCGGRQRLRDFFAIELYDGIPYVVIDLGDRVNRFVIGKRQKPVNDGMPHHLRVKRVQKALNLSLDDEESTENIVSADSTLDLATFFFVGAVNNPARLPWYLWTRRYKFFVGCLWGLRINDGDVKDLPRLAVEQHMLGIEVGCKAKPLACLHKQCSQGRCEDRYDGFECLCENTSYYGQLCEKDAPMMSYTGSEMSNVTFHSLLKTHTNDMSLRFKTPKDSGVLFSVGKKGINDHLKAFLEGGLLKIETNIGGVMQESFQMVLRCDMKLSDDQWHTLYIRRRANYLESFVDICPRITVVIPGEGYTLDVDYISVADISIGQPISDAYVGHMQNFIFDGINVFEIVQQHSQEPSNIPNVTSVYNTGELTYSEKPIPVHPVTFRGYPDLLLTLPAIDLSQNNAALRFMFKTVQPEAVLLFSEGTSPDFLAVEIVDGMFKLSANDGTGNVSVSSHSASMNDGDWHFVDIRQVSPKKFIVTVDGEELMLSLPNLRGTFDQMKAIHVGRMRRDVGMERWSTRKRFTGCLATVTVNGVLYDLSKLSDHVTPGCHDSIGYCTSDTCEHGGTCMEGFTGFICDCNMTSYVGNNCSEEAEGYYFGFENGHGLAILKFAAPLPTLTDKIALGFMTWNSNTTLMRISSGSSADYMDIRLENGYVTAVVKLSEEVIHQVSEMSVLANDSKYHALRVVRHGNNITLKVDDLRAIHETVAEVSSSLLTFMAEVSIGGIPSSPDDINANNFKGIIAGVYVNGYRMIDMANYGSDRQMAIHGDISIAEHPFTLRSLPMPTPTVSNTEQNHLTSRPGHTNTPQQDTEPQMPESGPLLTGMPSNIGGGGVAWEQSVESLEIVVAPGGAGGSVSVETAAMIDGDQPPVGSLVHSGGEWSSDVNVRAVAVTGGLLSLLVAASSAVWALYKFKPGLMKSRSASALFNNREVLTSPVSDVPLKFAEIKNGTVAHFIMPSNEGHVYTQTVLSTVNATGALTGFHSVSARQVSAGGSGIAGLIAGINNVTRGTQTDLVSIGLGPNNIGAKICVEGTISVTTSSVDSDRCTMDSLSECNDNKANAAFVEKLHQQWSEDGDDETVSSMSLSYHGGHIPSHSSVVDTASTSPTFDNIREHVLQRLESPGQLSQTYPKIRVNDKQISSQEPHYQQEMIPIHSHVSTMQRSPNQVEELTLNLDTSYSTARVDCIRLTADGRYVVTGSLQGPPQVWDIMQGKLVKVMSGDTCSATDLHLVCNDSMLVAEVTSDVTETIHHRLQIWDFASGIPLEMAEGQRVAEWCTASCAFADGERLALARVEPPSDGGGLTVIIYDLVGNEPIQWMHHHCSTSSVEQASFIAVSKDSHHVVTAYQRVPDNVATFISFDLTAADFSASVKRLHLDALAKMSVVFGNNNIITGTRSGQLVVWNMSSGQLLGHLVTRDIHGNQSAAHVMEITALDISRDKLRLVSASADTTLKVWDLISFSFLFAFVGHRDKVTCCSFSDDGELVLSGSSDGTIRVWRVTGGVAPLAVCEIGVDLHRVLMTSDKQTIVAVGERSKLVLLHVSRTRTLVRVGASKSKK